MTRSFFSLLKSKFQTDTSQTFGEWGEGQASIFLKSRGYTITENNFRTRYGEIDIIAWRGMEGDRTLCFVEVKTRRGESGSAERAHDQKKMDRIMRAARSYCSDHSISLDSTPICFEHVSVYASGDREVREVRHYPVIFD
jgi:putative endonuclease